MRKIIDLTPVMAEEEDRKGKQTEKSRLELEFVAQDSESSVVLPLAIREVQELHEACQAFLKEQHLL